MSCFRDSVGVSRGVGMDSDRSGIEAENRMIRYTSCSGSSGTVVMLELAGAGYALCGRDKQLGGWAAVRLCRVYRHAWLAVSSSARYSFLEIMVESCMVDCAAATR